jgi:hypothetical protein
VTAGTRLKSTMRTRAWCAALLLLVACSGPSASQPSGTGVSYAVGGRAVAGPTCPAEPASPLPGQCSPRPVAGAVLVIADATGDEVVRVTTAPDGSFSVDLPEGLYTLEPQPVAGLLGVAPPQTFTVSRTLPPGTDLLVTYDTGIR